MEIAKKYREYRLCDDLRSSPILQGRVSKYLVPERTPKFGLNSKTRARAYQHSIEAPCAYSLTLPQRSQRSSIWQALKSHPENSPDEAYATA